MAAMVGMDQATEEWEQVFQELIREVKPRHTWTLVTDKNLLPNVLQQGWSQYQQQTFARFQCSSCPRSWASAHVQVLFHMRWSSKKHRGQVKMRVFSQRCQQCAQPQFEVPEFTLENIRRILTNLVFRILRKCYKEEFKMMEEMPTAKDARLEGPHDSVNCEACLQGFCVQRGLGLAPQGSAPPSLSTSLKDAGVSGATTTCSHSPRSPSPKADQLLVLAVTPKHPKLSKADPKVSHASKPSGTLRIPTEEVSPPLTVLTVTPKVPDPPKADPKVSRTLKPSAAPRYLSEEVSPPFTVLTVTPKVPDPPKADPKVSRTSKPSAAPRYLSEVVSPPLTVTPEVPDPPNADAKVHNWLATHVPSPTNSWATAGAAAWDTRVPVPPWRRPDACSPQQSPAPTRRSLCCCCRYLLIVIVTVAVLVLVFKLL